LNKIFIYYLFAQKFGWTPEQVNRLPMELVIMFQEIIKSAEDVSNREMERSFK